MNNDSKLAQSIQKDYRRYAQIEREFGPAGYLNNKLVQVAAVLASLALLTNLVAFVAS